MLAQLQGVLSITFLVTVFFSFFPTLFFEWYGAFAGALIGGLYILFLNYKQYANLKKTLMYVPTGKHLEFFQTLVRACGLQLDDVSFRYAYTAGQIVMTVGNLVIIDPTLCSLADGDSVADTVNGILAQHVEPNLSEHIKKRFAEHKKLLTPTVQEFLIKHEIGHVADNYSIKSLLVHFVQGAFTVYIGIVAVQSMMGYGLPIALPIGMVAGFITDILSTFVMNMVFRYCSEKKADNFAALHSSVNQINTAANFFVEHQKIADQYNDFGFIMKHLPTVVVSGYPAGSLRAAYLRALADQKQNN